MAERRVSLFKNGRNQAVRIPREFELPGEEAILRKEGDRLVLEPTVAALPTLAVEAPADATYGRLRTALEKARQPIGGNDLLIAAHAVTLGHALVTDNEREFGPVTGLRWENWLR